jgi:hypothetical protein
MNRSGLRTSWAESDDDARDCAVPRPASKRQQVATQRSRFTSADASHASRTSIPPAGSVTYQTRSVTEDATG